MRIGVSVANAIDAPWMSPVDVQYVDGLGELVIAPIGTASQVRFEFLSATRSPVSFKGQRAFAGSWWCATTRSHVAFGSWVARDRLMALDFDPAVVGVAFRPLSLHWRADGVDSRYEPDYFVRRQDGTVFSATSCMSPAKTMAQIDMITRIRRNPPMPLST